MKKKLPKFKTDKEVKDFMKNDISDYINAENFIPLVFEFKKKDKTITLRLPSSLLDALKASAKKEGINYQKIIRNLIESFVKHKKVA
jgi:predicted DNA binding CopG/RHH family protein